MGFYLTQSHHVITLEATKGLVISRLNAAADALGVPGFNPNSLSNLVRLPIDRDVAFSEGVSPHRRGTLGATGCACAMTLSAAAPMREPGERRAEPCSLTDPVPLID